MRFQTKVCIPAALWRTELGGSSRCVLRTESCYDTLKCKSDRMLVNVRENIHGNVPELSQLEQCAIQIPSAKESPELR